MNTYECLKFCDGAQNKKDVAGWETLHEFDYTSGNKQFDARVYKNSNRIVIAFSWTEYNGLDDVRNCISSLFYSDKIPAQYYDAENLYNEVKKQYPYHVIEFAGYSLGGTLANLLSHKTGFPSMAIAPIGSKHIASKYSNYFKYNDWNIFN